MKKIDYGKDYFVSEDGKVFSKKRGKTKELPALRRRSSALQIEHYGYSGRVFYCMRKVRLGNTHLRKSYGKLLL